MRQSVAAVKKALGGHQVAATKPGVRQAPDPYSARCPTRVVLDRIGDKWTVLVLGLLRDNPMRFNALRRAIEGMTQKMLAQTLKALERDGLVSRTVRATTPVAVEYAVTPLGLTLTSTLESLQQWARDNIDEVVRSQRQYDEAIRL